MVTNEPLEVNDFRESIKPLEFDLERVFDDELELMIQLNFLKLHPQNTIPPLVLLIGLEHIRKVEIYQTMT